MVRISSLGEGVKELGGLHILGTSRHESRRIDNQLRGRSGRQGDPGSSRFYLSLEDDLLRIFGGDRIHAVMDRLGIEEGEHIEHKFISKAIENAQSKVEGHNFEIRKHLLEYDDVMNQQREVIYRQRRKALEESNLKQVALDMIEDLAYELVEGFAPEKTPIKDWDLEGLDNDIKRVFQHGLVSLDQAVAEKYSADQVSELLFNAAKGHYQAKEALIGSEQMRQLERFIILQTVDSRWKEHLLSMDHLKEGIGLRGYAQQDPLRIYRKEGFAMFQGLMHRIKEEVVDILFKIQLASPDQVDEMKRDEQQDLTFSHSDEPRNETAGEADLEKRFNVTIPAPAAAVKNIKNAVWTDLKDLNLTECDI